MKTLRFIIIILALSALPATSSTLSKPTYLKGWYCDSDNVKHEGYIWYDEMNFNHFYFKEDLNSKKEKFDLQSALCFSFNDRVFTKINHVKVNNGLWKTEKPEVFAELMVEGKANLYRVYGKFQQAGVPVYSASGNHGYYYGGSKQLVNYLVKTSTIDEYVLLSKNKTKFREEISQLLYNNKAAEEIVSKGYTLDNIKEIIQEYNK